MPRTFGPHPARRRSAVAVVLVLAVLGSGSAALATTSPGRPQVPDAVLYSATQGQAPAGDPGAPGDPTKVPPTPPSVPAEPPETVRMVQANLYTSMPDDQLAADVATVFGGDPDVVTLNEVGRRSDAQITPSGYAVYRSPTNVWTAETAVLWRTDRWQEVATGTRYLTQRRVLWGQRAVNWVTLRSRASGRVVSVISAHAPPLTRRTAGLLPVFAQGLADLVRELGLGGSVLVGGDLNVGFLSPSWPAATWAQAGLAATYDVLGRPVGGTGDEHHATIDYVLFQQHHGLTPVEQGTTELNSDHRAVWAELALD